MQKGRSLEFSCLSCKKPVTFSVFDLNKQDQPLTCSCCNKKYLFDDEILLRQLGLFEKLCRQIHESKEILSQTSVGVDIGSHQVNIPFKILLTRLSSRMDLMMGDTPLTIMFRIEPTEEIPTT